MKNLTHKHGVNTIASYGFTYDDANRITQSSGTDGIQDYTYDDTNQLTGANHTTQANEAYSYDANGNRTNSGYGTGTDNRLLTDGVYNYSYDDEGNRTKRTEIATGKVTEYNWDYRNRLTSVVFKDAGGNVVKTIAYSYDVNDRRISKKIDGVVAERYVYDGANIALVFDGAGVQTHRYLYGTGVDQILADERGGSVVWALADNLGTVRDVVDGGGVVLNHVTYDSFGKVVSQSNASVEFRYGYTGREADSETGLDYYRARYYDASTGRFISEDPIGFNAGDTNLYRYVGNSPTNAIDPSGLLELPLPIKNDNPLNTPLGELKKHRNTTKKNTSQCPIPDPEDPCNRKPLDPNSELTKEFLQQLIQEAANIKGDEIEREQRTLDRKTQEYQRNNPGGKVPEKYQKNRALQRNVAVGLHEFPNGTQKIVVTVSNGRLSGEQTAYLRGKGYIVSTPSDVATGAKLIDENGNPTLDRNGKQKIDDGTGGWHAEGRQKQYSINNNTKLKSIGVSKNFCPSCAKDVKGVKTLNTILKDYKNTPKNRPSTDLIPKIKRRKVPGDKKC